MIDWCGAWHCIALHCNGTTGRSRDGLGGIEARVDDGNGLGREWCWTCGLGSAGGRGGEGRSRDAVDVVLLVGIGILGFGGKVEERLRELK